MTMRWFSRAVLVCLVIVAAGCASTVWYEIDWHGRPLSELAERIGQPARIIEVGPELSIAVWLGDPFSDVRDPNVPSVPSDPANTPYGASYTRAFFVRPASTLIGPAKFYDPMVAGTNVKEIVAILGPPTRVETSVPGSALYTWEPQAKGTSHMDRTVQNAGVLRRLTLVVGRHGTVLDWS